MKENRSKLRLNDNKNTCWIHDGSDDTRSTKLVSWARSRIRLFSVSSKLCPSAGAAAGLRP